MATKFKIFQLTCFILGCVDGICSTGSINELSLTLKEKQILDKFKDKVVPILPEAYMKTDFYLIRWLRAKDFNMFAAESMLAKNLKWRKDNNIDRILSEQFDDMKMDFPSSVDTYDKTGRPKGTLDISQWSIRNAVVTGRGQRLLRYIYMLMETTTDEVIERQKKGMNVTQWIILMHAEGVTMVEHGCPMCLRIWMQFLYGLENYYPGWMKECIATDASPSMNLIMNVGSPFLSRYVTENIHIFGSERNKWMQYLDARIARTERRELYGGTKK